MRQSGLSFLTRCALFLAVLLGGYLLTGQEAPPTPIPSQSYESLVDSIKSNIAKATVLSQTLTVSLTQQSANYKMLQMLLDELSERLSIGEQTISKLEADLILSQNSSQAAQAELSQAKEQLGNLKALYSKLLISFDNYQKTSEGAVQALSVERDWWRVGAIGSFVAFVIALLAALLT
jgi:hypothetical protein